MEVLIEETGQDSDNEGRATAVFLGGVTQNGSTSDPDMSAHMSASGLSASGL